MQASRTLVFCFLIVGVASCVTGPTAYESRRGATPQPAVAEQPAGLDYHRSESVVHLVVSGDTLHRVAQLHHTTVETLRRLNPDVDPRRLAVGTALTLPGGKPRIRNVETRPAHHETRAGDRR